MFQYSELENVNDEDLPLPVRVARGAAFALWPLSKSTKNKLAIQKAGGLSLLSRWVRTSWMSEKLASTFKSKNFIKNLHKNIDFTK